MEPNKANGQSLSPAEGGTTSWNTEQNKEEKMIGSNEAKSTCGNPAGGRTNNNSNDSCKMLRVDSGEQAAGADAENVYNLPSKKEDVKMENKQEERTMHPTTRIPFGHLSVHIPGQLTLAELEALENQKDQEIQKEGVPFQYEDGVYTFPGLGGKGWIRIQDLGKKFHLECNNFKGNPYRYLRWCKDQRKNTEGCKHVRACLRVVKANKLIKRRAMTPEDQKAKGRG